MRVNAASRAHDSRAKYVGVKIPPLLRSTEATSKKLLKHIRAAAKICGHGNYELAAGFGISGFDPKRLRL